MFEIPLRDTHGTPVHPDYIDVYPDLTDAQYESQLRAWESYWKDYTNKTKG